MIAAGIGRDLFTVNANRSASTGAVDVVRDFQVGLDQLVVNTGSGQVVFDRNAEVDDLRGNPLLAGVTLQLTPDLRASSSKLQAISGQTSLLGAGLRLARTDAGVRQAEIRVKGGSQLIIDPDSLPTGIVAQLLDQSTRVALSSQGGASDLDPATLRNALAAVRFLGTGNGSVEIRAIDSAGRTATTTERPFVLVTPVWQLVTAHEFSVTSLK